MSNDTKVAELPAKWIERASKLRSYFSDDAAEVLETAAAELQAALARQGADKKAVPAGQEIAGWEIYSETGRYVTYVKTESQRDAQLWRGDDGELPEWKAVAVYAAPPAAQAVDLEKIREAVERIKGHARYSRDRYAISTQARVSGDDLVSECDRLLSIIDQQAGKGDE